MTTQRSDVFRVDGIEHSILGLKGEGFYSAQDLGITALSVVSACLRGYVMKYDCIDRQLILEGMEVYVKEPVSVNDIEPQLVLNLGDHNAVYYEGLGIKTSFSGKLLLAKDFLRDERPTTFHPPTLFTTVIEIDVEKGDITHDTDHSIQIEKLRKQRGEANITLSFEQTAEEDMAALGFDSTTDIPKW